jgi:hypothetical protein
MRTALAIPLDHRNDQTDQHAADPLELFVGAPLPGHVPAVAALARAYAHFRSHYRADDPEHRLILDGAERAFTAVQERTWQVLPDGTLEIAGSKDTIYLVDDTDCRQKGRTRFDTRSGRHGPALCPSFQFYQRQHGGMCYHLIARELIRLAQQFDATTTVPSVAAPDTTYLPFVTLAGRLLGLALGIARLPEQPVRLQLDAPRLHVIVGDTEPIHCVTVTGEDGSGQVTVQLDAAAFAALWQPFRPVASQLPLVTLFVDLTDGLVLISGDDVAVEARGVLLHP